MGITSLDKALDNVSRVQGKVKEELTVTKRLGLTKDRRL